jgi:hypothetical protein
MYLELCGELQLQGEDADGRYCAPFRPERYPAALLNESEVPLYLLVEALAQVGCRASAREFFAGARTIPVQVNSLRAGRKVLADQVGCTLTASVQPKGAMAVADCELVDASGEVVASATLWCAVLKTEEKERGA